MPKEYLAIKNQYKKKGKSDKEAKRIAAATYNKYIYPKKGGKPVGQKEETEIDFIASLITDDITAGGIDSNPSELTMVSEPEKFEIEKQEGTMQGIDSDMETTGQLNRSVTVETVDGKKVINATLELNGVPEEDIRQLFDEFMEKLEASLQAGPASEGPGTMGGLIEPAGNPLGGEEDTSEEMSQIMDSV
jgi:hypothetical protein